MTKIKDSSYLSRRDFVEILLVSAAAGILTACARLIGATESSRTPEVPAPPTNTQVSPLPSATLSETPSPSAEATPTIDCEESVEPSSTPDGLDRSNVKPAKTRELTEISYAIIHHSQVEGAEDYCHLVKHARSYDCDHSKKDYDNPPDGVIDAEYTDGKLGYKWITYHFLIARDGFVLPVQDPTYMRIHSGNNEVNDRSIAICIDGDFRNVEESGILDELPTTYQLESAAKIIRDWNEEHNTKLIIKSHREVACLEKNVMKTGLNLLVPVKTWEIQITRAVSCLR